ncbi:hypothetical protein Bca4012_007859 [Brassica carinata]|uniref:Uncharacterized protein n=1 Tax=Brassica napus TaxID=3708 RepID=A0ABQ8AQL0_BRANA|nr:hypothetical protein HID58_057253 [Brassica napus]
MGDLLVAESHQRLSAGPRNKLAPASFHPYERNKGKSPEKKEKEYSSPPYTRRKFTHQEEEHEHGIHRERNRASPNLQWRVKSLLLNQEVTPPSAPFQPPRPSVERNLNAVDFPAEPTVPSREEVMKELREVTLQYLNCPDPVESAA